MSAKKNPKNKHGQTTTAAGDVSNSIPATLSGSLINMSVTLASSGSVLLCLFAAKRLI